MSGSHVVGLDLSLTCTGIGRVFPDGQAWAEATPMPTKEISGHERLAAILDLVRDFTTGDPACDYADLVVIEGGSMGSFDGDHVLAILRGLVKHQLWGYGIPYAEVSPSTLKLFATGHGRYGKGPSGRKEGKAAMLAAARHAWPTCDITNDDEADALWLSAAGLWHLGLPVAAHTPEALNVVKWPEMPGAEITIRAMETTE